MKKERLTTKELRKILNEYTGGRLFKEVIL